MTLKTGKLTPEQEQEIDAFRAALCFEVGKCEVCRVTEWPAVCGHEIIHAGGVRRFTKGNRSLVLVCCDRCHTIRIHQENMPVVVQLAYLHRSRPRDLRLSEVNRWSINRIARGDVLAAARELDAGIRGNQ
jgi:hypothetical protein